MLTLGGEIASIAGVEIFTNSATFLFRFLSGTPTRPAYQVESASHCRYSGSPALMSMAMISGTS
jgi:hypothetical protein